MHYSLLLHFPERPREDLTPEEMRNGMNYFDRFVKELEAAGVLVSAELFESSSETVTVRLVNETIEELDGPEEEVHAPLGGIIVIDVDNHQQAVRYAHRAPSMVWGPTEIRGTMPRFVDGEWRAEQEVLPPAPLYAEIPTDKQLG